MALFVISFVLSGLVAWLLSRSIVRTIRNVSDSMELILNTSDNGKSDLTTRIPVHTNDEIGELAMTMNKLLELQEDNSWAQQHIMELGNRLQGASALEALAEQFVRYTSNALNVPHIAFYVIPFLQVKNKLKLAAAGGGSGSLTGLPEFIEFGEGLVGLCALDQQVRSFDVPGTYLRISSGLGGSRPSHLLLIPVLFEGSTLGVLELASFSPFSERAKEWSLQATELLGSALNRVLTHMEIESLLRESQAMTEELQVQTEELQTQQEELEASNEQIGKQYLMAEEKTNELQQIQEELTHYASELELSSRYKSEFLANMSHELRTPLNSMLILSQMLAENPSRNLSPKEEEFARVIHSAGSDLLDLINDILDLSKIESGKMELDLGPVNMSELPRSIEGPALQALLRKTESNLECSEQRMCRTSFIRMNRG